MDFIQEEERNLRNIFNRFRKRDFSGNTGQAIKNSIYQFAQGLIFKFGSLLFTIILARMLLPELFGLYSLALVTIVLFASFSDLGISSALITFGAKMLGKNNLGKTKAYVQKLLRWKIYLVFMTSGILLLTSYFIANNYYHKPIFYALLVGAIYLPIVTILGFVERSFKMSNNFKYPLIKEIIFQISRFVLVPLGIFFLFKTNLTSELIIASILLLISFCYLTAFIFLIRVGKKRLSFLNVKAKNLKTSEINELKKFLLPLTAMALSGVFFGYIDILMLGHYVSIKFIAYYGVAFSLVGATSVIIGFASMALFPIFSKLRGSSLEKLFKKTRNLTLVISILSGIIIYLLAWWIIRLAYGEAYLTAVPILKYFSILLLILPTIALYTIYFTSQKKTKTLAWLLIGSTILNIIFNLIGINYGLRFGEFEAVLGATIATIASRFLYLGGLILFRKN